MRVWLAVGVCLLASAVLAACSTYCSSASGLAATLQSKWGNCDAGQGVVLDWSSQTSWTGAASGCAAACQTAYDACPSADQTHLSNALSCFEGLPSCTPGQEDTWLHRLVGCAPSSDSGTLVSAACSAAFAAEDGGGC